MEAERSLYSSFVTAANAVSSLYAQAAAQQQNQREQAVREALERVLSAAIRASSEGYVPIAALVNLANAELSGQKNAEGSAFPIPYIPELSGHEDESMAADGGGGAAQRGSSRRGEARMQQAQQ